MDEPNLDQQDWFRDGDLYRQLTEAAPDAMLAVDSSGKIIFANRQCEPLLGWRPGQLIGQPFEVLLPPWLRDIHARNRATYSEDPRERRLGSGLAFTALRPDGTEAPIDMAVTPVQTAHGLVTLATVRDATVMRRVEQALVESDSRAKTSLDRMLDGFAILRSVREGGEIVDFEWVYINPAGAATYGRSVELTIGARMRTVAPGIVASGIFDEYRHLVDTGEASSRMQVEYHDEAVHGVFDRLTWKLDDGFAVTWRDVSDRERAVAALNSTERRFRSSIEQLHEALSVFSAVRDERGFISDFRWEFANSAASAITGYSAPELTGKTLMQVLPNHGPSGMLAVYRDVVETGETYTNPTLWFGDVWGDGRLRRRAFDVRATKVDDGFVVVTREVTDEREQEQVLARQRDELERSNTEIKLLFDLASMLQSCATSEEAYSVVTQSCAAMFPGLSGSVSVMHPSGDVLDIRARWGDNPVTEHRFAPADCWGLRRGRPYVSGLTALRCAHLSASTAKRCLCVPMVGQVETLGVFHLASFDADDEEKDVDDLEGGTALRLAVAVAGQLSLALANLRLRDSLREMSIRDSLTGLFNRRYMEETLSRELSLAARQKTELAILVIDVDHFKAFNDAHGHDAGDVVLRAVADVLMSNSRASDVACRFGGEEFILILPNCSAADAKARAEKLCRLASPLVVPYRRTNLAGPTLSCGVAAFPDHATAAAKLIHEADNALYAAKEAGRNQVVVAPLGPLHEQELDQR